MSWRIHADPTSLIGGIRALLLQALSIPSMVAVDLFSRYHDDPLGRFNRTTMFVAETTFGSSDDVIAAIEGVKAMHKRVRGTDPETGVSFAAGDPHLLAFIHNCYTDSMLDSYSTYVSPLSLAEKNLYLEEQAQIALLLGAKEDEVVTDYHKLAQQISSMDNLGVVDATWRGFQQLKQFPLPPSANFLSLPWSLVFDSAKDRLPQFAKDYYGITSNVVASSLRRPAMVALGLIARNVLPGHPTYRSAKYRHYEATTRRGVA